VDEAFGAEVLEVGVGRSIEVLECIFSNLTSIFNSFQSVFLGVFLDGSSALIVTSASSGRFESSTSDILDALLVFLEEGFSFVFSVVEEASEAEVLEGVERFIRVNVDCSGITTVGSSSETWNGITSI